MDGRCEVDIRYDDFYRVEISQKFPQTREEVGDRVGDELTHNQTIIIENIKNTPSITAGELANIVGISKRKIEENIKKLKEKEKIKRVGNAKSGYWEIAE